MDHFESIVATLLEAEHYWIRRSFKVNVSRQEKRSVGKHSMPRPEIDLLAFNFAKNEVLAVEVKSYLNSPGVKLEALLKTHEVSKGRYKLFTSEGYRNVVLARLRAELVACGMANQETTVRLGLVAGKVYRGRSEEVRAHMARNGWFFWSPEEIKQKVEKLAECAYVNDPAILTAKILLRGKRKRSSPSE